MYIAGDWKDYEVIDTGGGEKLERWGDIILRRPDPQIIWPLANETAKWRMCTDIITAARQAADNGK